MKLPILLLTTTISPVLADLRELTADRPDTTESPITVDAGHFQIETGLYEWSRNGNDDVHTWMSTNVKYGLTDNSDIQFVFDSFIHGDAEGFGDITVRYKHNLWGNDGGKTAFGIMPFVTIPTHTAMSESEWQGGLILPFSVELSESWSLATMAEVDLVNDPNGSHELQFVHSVSLGKDITDTLGGFLEYVGIVTNDDYEAFGSTGLTYQIGTNMMIDGGCRFGLNDAAEDFGLFTGFTIRF